MTNENRNKTKNRMNIFSCVNNGRKMIKKPLSVNVFYVRFVLRPQQRPQRENAGEGAKKKNKTKPYTRCQTERVTSKSRCLQKTLWGIHIYIIILHKHDL